MNKTCLLSILVLVLAATGSAWARSSFCYNHKQGPLGMSLFDYTTITNPNNCPDDLTEKLACQECLKKEAGNSYYYHHNRDF